MTGYLVGSLVFLVAVGAQVGGGPRRFFRGRHLSRPICRRVGYRRAYAIRHLCYFVAAPFPALDLVWVWTAVMVVPAVWALDDWLFPDDDDRRRKHEWAKARLRMPKPVKLRPVEKWNPVPA